MLKCWTDFFCGLQRMKFSDSMLYRALPDCEYIDCTVHCASAYWDCLECWLYPFEQKSPSASNSSKSAFFLLLANAALIVLLFRDWDDLRLKSRSRDCVKWHYPNEPLMFRMHLWMQQCRMALAQDWTTAWHTKEAYCCVIGESDCSC